MKRFTETDKWKDPWFQSLKGSHKLIFIFLIENCNNAGFYEVNMPMMVLQTGLDIPTIEGALKGLERVIQGASGWLWIKNFLRHQKNESLNPVNPAHKQIIEYLKPQVGRFSSVPDFVTWVAPYKGLLSPIGLVEVKDKVKKEKEIPMAVPDLLDTSEFQETWAKWEKYRKEKKGGSLTNSTRELQFKKMIALGIPESIAMIEHSIENGWAGLFPTDGKNGNSDEIKHPNIG